MAGKPIVVVPDDINNVYAGSPELARLQAVAAVELHATRARDETELAARVGKADAILSFRPAFTRFPKSVIAVAPALKLICISGTGVEDVDMAEATRRGIAVANVVGTANKAVAELCLGLMLSVARSISAQDRSIRNGQWTPRQGIELGGRTLGLVGLGGIAHELAPMARALGMQVISWSRNNDPVRAQALGVAAVELDELLQRSDVVSLHARLNDATRHMIGRAQFARMKPGAILINTARGGLVDEAAMIETLSSGRLAGAGLDVFAAEPLPADHPLLSLDNVVMTPVAGWSTAESSARMIGQSIDNVVGFLAGHPINVVNAAALKA
jgi:phosphoglycerate dehydrogenase-like enzyme